METNELAEALEKFAQARDWEKFHVPRSLMLALVGEVGELAAIMQWESDQALGGDNRSVEISCQLSDEIADILIYVVRLADVLGIDVDDAVNKKLAKNAVKYPAS